jgi:hypothetical protein
VTTEPPSPQLSIGDFVRCTYELFNYYYPSGYIGADPDEPFARYGIIIEVDLARFGELFGYEIMYYVLCTDGTARYYSEHEIEKVS